MAPKHENITSDAHQVIVVCSTKGGGGYVVSDVSTSVEEAVESAWGYGGTLKVKGYTVYEFGPGVEYWGHNPLHGIQWSWTTEEARAERRYPTITQRNRLGRVTEVVATPEGPPQG